MTLRCEIGGKALIEGDASLLMEAISNLIDNAMKFGPPGGSITVSWIAFAGHLRRDAPLHALKPAIVAVLDDHSAIERRLFTRRKDVASGEGFVRLVGGPDAEGRHHLGLLGREPIDGVIAVHTLQGAP